VSPLVVRVSPTTVPSVSGIYGHMSGRLELCTTDRSLLSQQFVDSQYIYNVTDLWQQVPPSHAIHAFPGLCYGCRTSRFRWNVVVKHEAGQSRSDGECGMLMIELLQKTAVAELSQPHRISPH